MNDLRTVEYLSKTYPEAKIDQALFHCWVQEYTSHYGVEFVKTYALIELPNGDLIREQQDRIIRFIN